MIISEQEKNRIRGLHGTAPVLMSEQDKKWYQFWKKNSPEDESAEDLPTPAPSPVDKLPLCSEIDKYEGWEFVRTTDPRGPVPGAPIVSNLEGITFSHYTAINPEATQWVVAFRGGKAFCKVTS